MNVSVVGPASGGRKRGVVGTLETERREAARARREGHRMTVRHRRHRDRRTVAGEVEIGDQGVAGRCRPGHALVVADAAVPVGVHRLPLLEGGDLRHVDDDLEVDRVAGDGQAGVVVDREVAEGMGARGGRKGGTCRHRAEAGRRDDEPAKASTTIGIEGGAAHVDEGTTARAGRMTGRRERGDSRAAPYTPAVTRPITPTGRGRFISFEGPEGSGKTTQAARLGGDPPRARRPDRLDPRAGWHRPRGADPRDPPRPERRRPSILSPMP